MAEPICIDSNRPVDQVLDTAAWRKLDKQKREAQMEAWLAARKVKAALRLG